MRVVADRIEPLRLALRQVILVGENRTLVRGRRIRIPADAQVDVCWHVDHVTSRGHQPAQSIRAALSAIGIV
jgi:hypothetical protein